MANKIKTFKDACKALKLKTDLPDVSALPKKHQKSLLANYQLIIIAEALNEGWKPDWSDWNQSKYFPYFEAKVTKGKFSGFGFSRTYYADWRTDALVGSRLCFKNRELAQYFGKQFLKLHNDHLTL